jgi:cyclomaltodextrinase / maltogenic alpha-amylase / neopullulanase
MLEPFDASKSYHKSIIGTTAAGETLRLRVLLPRNFGVTHVGLILKQDGSDDEYMPFSWESTDNVNEWWYTDIRFDTPGVYFYCFEYETGWGKTPIKRVGLSQHGSIDGDGCWEQFVYSRDMQTPDNFSGGVFYQIFPDRFCYSGKKKENVPTDRVIRSDWGDTPEWKPDSKGIIRNNDFFCGDFKGITEKIGYLKELGVTCIYLNPICESHSNHRYDTADYMKPDPLLGTDDDFKSLCDTAHQNGIKVLIDGVYSHTGADSVYFNKYGRYGDGGAYNDENSEYRTWYHFGKDRDDYKGWWNFDTLPEVNELNVDYLNFITGENGVIDKWMKLGADGIRLDVADELPDEFIEQLRIAVKRHGSDKMLLGEVWEDASNKISGGGRRRYFCGSELDSVMNYPFKDAITDFMLTSDAELFMDRIYSVVLDYPPKIMNLCMNFLGTHDTQRILTLLSGYDCENMTRQKQSDLLYTPEMLGHAKKLYKAAVCILYTLPGIPCIYYGDEAGLLGGRDPFNRGCFPWGGEDHDLQSFHRMLGAFRKNESVLKDGGFYPLSASLGCIAFLRYKEGFGRVACISNKNPDTIYYSLNPDMQNMHAFCGGENIGGTVMIPPETTCILTD